MKRLLLSLFVVVVFVSCIKESSDRIDGPLSHISDGDSTIVTLGVTLEGQPVDCETKVEIASSTGVPTWTSGDAIAYCISNGSTSEWRLANVDIANNRVSVALPGGYSLANYAVYPYSAKASDPTSSSVVYKTGYDLEGVNLNTYSYCPMMAVNNGGTMAFYHVGALIRIHLDNVPEGVKSLQVVFNGMEHVTGTYTVTNAGTSSAYCTLSSGTGNTVAFTYGGADFPSDFYLSVPCPSGDYSSCSGISVIMKNSSFATVTSVKDESSLGTVSRAAGRVLSPNSFGLFSVSNTKSVRFAPGNLVATITAGPFETQNNYNTSSYYNYVWESKLSFEEHQYDGLLPYPSVAIGIGTRFPVFVKSLSGTENSYGRHYYGVYTGWYYSSTNYCIGYSTSNNSRINVSYGDLIYTPSDQEYYEHYCQPGLSDDIVSKYGSGWTLPTYSEMSYLLSTRVNAADKVGYAHIGNVNGLVLLPDFFTLPENCTFINKATGSKGNNCNNYTLDVSGTSNAWCDMEAAGAVFLPCTGSFVSRTFTTVLADLSRTSSSVPSFSSYLLLDQQFSTSGSSVYSGVKYLSLNVYPSSSSSANSVTVNVSVQTNNNYYLYSIRLIR